MEDYPRFRRRNYFIKKGLQGRFVIWFSLLVLVGFLLNITGAYFLIDRELGAGLYKTHLKIRATSELVQPVLWKLGVVTVPVIVMVAAFVGYYLTRRLEFPMLDFIDALRKAADGDFTVRMDKDTENLEEIATRFNKTVTLLDKSFGTVKKSITVFHRRFERLNFLLTEEEGPAVKDALKELARISSQREAATKELSRYRV